VGFEQLFQLFHGPHRPQPGAEAKTQARGAASVAQELDGAAQGGEGLPWQAYGPAWCRAGWLASCLYACASISRGTSAPRRRFFRQNHVSLRKRSVLGKRCYVFV
jgi:hypothetical protein